MAEEADVDHDRHAGNQLKITVRAEEGGLRFHQADGVDKRADQILHQAVLFKILSAGDIQLTAGHTGLQDGLRLAQNLAQMVDELLLARRVDAADGENVAHGARIAVHARRNADHDQLAVLHNAVRRSRDDGLCTLAGADDGGIGKARCAVCAADGFACSGDFVFICARADGSDHLVIGQIAQMRGGENLLVFPRALVGAERLIFVGDVDELDAGEAGLEVNVDLMRNGRRADKADAECASCHHADVFECYTCHD